METSEKIVAIAIVILMALPITAITVPTAKATYVSAIGNTPPTTQGFANLGPLPSGVTPAYTFTSVPYMSFSPNPIGVGQSLLVNVWTSPGMYHAFAFTGYKVDIIKPDGTTMTVGPFNSYVGDATAWFNIVPDQVGTWQFKFSEPGMYIPPGQYWDAPGSTTGGFIATSQWLYIGASIYYTAGSTDWQNLTVQQNMVMGWPYRSLTTDYWTRPINPMWRDWGTSVGDYPFNTVWYWPDGTALYPNNYKFTAYVTAPNSCHVLWKRTLPLIGPAGMNGGFTQFDSYSTLATAGTPSIIYMGRCYQSISKILDNGTQITVLQCYDLRTGTVYFERAGLPATPSIIEYTPPGTNYAIGSTNIARDTLADQGWVIDFIAFTGSQMYKFSPASGAITLNCTLTQVTTSGPAVYITLSTPTYYMPGYALAVQTIGTGASATYRLLNITTFGTNPTLVGRIVSNITWPYASLTGLFGGTYDAQDNLVGSIGWNTPPGPQWGIGAQIQVVDASTGALLWNLNTNDTVTENDQSPSSLIMNFGKLAYGAHGRHWICFNARTGTILWTSEQTEYPWGAWWPYNTAQYQYNSTSAAIIAVTYEGVYAINWADGKILWHFSTEPYYVPFEGPYNAQPFFTGVVSADGKIYTYNGEHTPTFPRTRGWSTWCINATNGQLIWRIYNPMTPGAIADGYLTASNTYDGYMYVFGIGPSSTTVTATPKTPTEGSQILIEGTVMDQSPGQPNTPCVNDASMELQMEYIHEQMPIAGLWGNQTITGVPVTLTAIAADGTVTDLGTVTTNGYYGTFGYSWTPAKAGLYTILASFNGDDSYGTSSAATMISVGAAPTVTAAPTPTPTPTATTQNLATTADLMTYIVVAAIAIIIAIAIVGALILRKK